MLKTFTLLVGVASFSSNNLFPSPMQLEMKKSSFLLTQLLYLIKLLKNKNMYLTFSFNYFNIKL